MVSHQALNGRCHVAMLNERLVYFVEPGVTTLPSAQLQHRSRASQQCKIPCVLAKHGFRVGGACTYVVRHSSRVPVRVERMVSHGAVSSTLSLNRDVLCSIAAPPTFGAHPGKGGGALDSKQLRKRRFHSFDDDRRLCGRSTTRRGGREVWEKDIRVFLCLWVCLCVWYSFLDATDDKQVCSLSLLFSFHLTVRR